MRRTVRRTICTVKFFTFANLSRIPIRSLAEKSESTVTDTIRPVSTTVYRSNYNSTVQRSVYNAAKYKY